ncbi:MAG: sulfatase [Planctomycetota bacterium]
MWLASLLLIAAPSDPPLPAPGRLFDLMNQAKVEGLTPGPTDVPGAAPVTTQLGFEAGTAIKLWFARPRDRDVEVSEGLGSAGALTAEGGVAGGALRLGPGVAEDYCYAALLVPVKPLHRYVVRGRVKLEHNPLADEASSREVLRVLEHQGSLTSLSSVPRRMHSLRRPQRVSRLRDPSPWDRFTLALLTGSATQTLEIELLHRTAGSDQAITWFDDLSLEETEVTEAELYQSIAAGYRKSDGREQLTPWRLRVPLMIPGDNREEHRDAVLLPPPARLSLPLAVPAASAKPLLRFHYGMLPEAFSVAGDGATIDVSFTTQAGERVLLGQFAFDPKNNASDRLWQRAECELNAVAGTTGTLTFAVADVAGSSADPLDAVVIATPRVITAAAAQPNVLLIGVDTLRADHLSAFHYSRPTTPNIEKLAATGTRFGMAFSQAPWTLPSFSSILTSLYPSAHGAGRGGHDEWTSIDPTTTALAEVLADHGYETQGITANFLIAPEYGLDQGFESYRVPGGRGWSMESVDIDSRGVVEFLEQHRSQPFFLFWHIMDPHLPYTTAPQFREQFTDPSYHGRFDGKNPRVPFEVLDPRPGRRWFAYEGPPPMPELTVADRAFVSDYYDAEVAEMDAGVGKVLDALDELGLSGRTIVGFIADHGEGLAEHNHYHHGYTLYQDQVHIPMIVRVPGAEPGREIARPVAAIDMAPTILAALDLPVPPSFQGKNRLVATADESDPIFIEYATYDSSALKACVQGRFKYLHDPLFHVEQLFDLSEDPGEKHSVLEANPDVAHRLRALLDQFRSEQLKKGRFHLRLMGVKGQRFHAELATDDLFDANFVAEPRAPERDFTMDPMRRTFTIDTPLVKDHIEITFWCRGTSMNLALLLDGKPVSELRIGRRGMALPASITRASIPTQNGDQIGAPRPNQAILWLEEGNAPTDAVVPSPENIEVLRQLGYVR